jgi:hypothetical protein
LSLFFAAVLLKIQFQAQLLTVMLNQLSANIKIVGDDAARLQLVKEIYFNVLESIALCEISSVGFISTRLILRQNQR